jgi:hypothetical protein
MALFGHLSLCSKDNEASHLWKLPVLLGLDFVDASQDDHSGVLC